MLNYHLIYVTAKRTSHQESIKHKTQVRASMDAKPNVRPSQIHREDVAKKV